MNPWKPEDQKMGFGKHFNKTMSYVLMYDAQYMEWFLRQGKMRKKYPHVLNFLLTLPHYRAYLDVFAAIGQRINVSKYKSSRKYREEINAKLKKRGENGLPLESEAAVANKQKLTDSQLIDHLCVGDFDLVKVETDCQSTGSGEPISYRVRMFRGNDFVSGVGRRVLVELTCGELVKGTITGIHLNQKLANVEYAGWVTSFIDESAHTRYMVFRNKLCLDLLAARKAKKEADALRCDIEGLNGHAPKGSDLESMLKEAAGISIEEIFKAVKTAREQTNEELAS